MTDQEPTPKDGDRGWNASLSRRLDALMTEFMSTTAIGAGSLGVIQNGAVAYRTSFGWMDRDRTIAVPDDLTMRVASLTKPVTAAAIRNLVADGRLALDAKVFDVGQVGSGILDLDPWRSVGDPRITDITIDHLLRHRGGWARKHGVNGARPQPIDEQEADAVNQLLGPLAIQVTIGGGYRFPGQEGRQAGGHPGGLGLRAPAVAGIRGGRHPSTGRRSPPGGTGRASRKPGTAVERRPWRAVRQRAGACRRGPRLSSGTEEGLAAGRPVPDGTGRRS